MIQALELNEVYGQCKKHPIHKDKGRKDKAAIEQAAETKKDK